MFWPVSLSHITESLIFFEYLSYVLSSNLNSESFLAAIHNYYFFFNSNRIILRLQLDQESLLQKSWFYFRKEGTFGRAAKDLRNFMWNLSLEITQWYMGFRQCINTNLRLISGVDFGLLLSLLLRHLLFSWFPVCPCLLPAPPTGWLMKPPCWQSWDRLHAAFSQQEEMLLVDGWLHMRESS